MDNNDIKIGLKEWLGNSQLGSDIINKKYLIKKDDGTFETFDEWTERVSGGNADVKRLFIEKKFIPAGRILSNRGIGKIGVKSSLSNCYVLSTDDSIEDIYKTCSDMARTYSYGGGVGIDISALRPSGAVVHNSARTTTGAISFMKTFDVVTGTIGQQGRRGALMISIDVNHPDLPDFIDIKANTDQITNANISIRVNDKFMKAVENNEDYILHWPCNTDIEEIESTVGVDFEYNILNKFDTLGKTIYLKKVKARDLFMQIAKNNWDFGEPGVLYWDRITSWHMMSANKEFSYAGVNPCLTGDTMVKTDNGDIRLDELVSKYQSGESVKVASYNIETNDIEYKEVYNGLLTRKKADIIKIETEDSTEIRLTPDHKVYTENRGWVEAGKLSETDILLKCERNNRIRLKNITEIENADVYDISVKDNHNFFANGILVHNCAEEPLPDGGACLLGSMNLYEYVKDDCSFDWEAFDKDVRIATVGLNEIQIEGTPLHPLEIQRKTARKYRQIGLGIFDLAGALIKMHIKYGSKEAKEFADKVTHSMLVSSFEQSCDLNTEGVVYDGLFESDFYKSRIYGYIKPEYRGKYPINSQLLTIAPTGSISTMLNAGAGGGEPLFRISYTRDTKSIGEKTYHVCSNAVLDYFNNDPYAVDENVLPEYYITADRITPKDRIEMQSALQRNIDASISSTINLPKTATVEDVYNIYMYAWKQGLKGVTVFRDGCKRTAILNTNESKEVECVFNTVNAPKRPKVLDADYYQVKVKGENFILIVGLLDEKPYELFALPCDNCQKVKNHRGKIIRLKKREYRFESEFLEIENLAIDIEKDYSVEDEIQKISDIVNEGHKLTKLETDFIRDTIYRIVDWMEKREYRNVALHVSGNLRTGMRIEDIIKLEEKCGDSIVSFPKAISRVLSKYQNVSESDEICPECGEKIIKEGGCCHCPSCGWSRCS